MKTSMKTSTILTKKGVNRKEIYTTLCESVISKQDKAVLILLTKEEIEALYDSCWCKLSLIKIISIKKAIKIVNKCQTKEIQSSGDVKHDIDYQKTGNYIYDLEEEIVSQRTGEEYYNGVMQVKILKQIYNNEKILKHYNLNCSERELISVYVVR